MGRESRAAAAAKGLPVELRVDVPGGAHARYDRDERTGLPRLGRVVYPDEDWPCDLCSVTDSLDGDGRPLPALLVGNISHPAGCLVPARALGLLEGHPGVPGPQLVVAVASDDPHFDDVVSVSALPEGRRLALELTARRAGPWGGAVFAWRGPQDAGALIRRAQRRYMLARLRGRTPVPPPPVWQPLWGTVRTPGAGAEAGRHSAAEYGYHALPDRFQRYVSESLAHDERMLWAVHRPAMRGSRRSPLFARRRLQEGVLIISDQQVTEVDELLPPGTAGIRYGFVARAGVPERLEEVRTQRAGRGHLALHVTWRAAHGHERVVWEFPAAQAPEVEAARRLLQGWLPSPQDRRLRRIAPPEPPEVLPELCDPAANDPAEVQPVAEGLQASLLRELSEREIVLARCLLPAWIEGRGAASMLAVTSRRVLVIPDPSDGRAERLRLSIALADISSLEFCSTLVMAYLRLYAPAQDARRPKVHTIHFGRTLAAMNTCYLMLRRALQAAQVWTAPASPGGRS